MRRQRVDSKLAFYWGLCPQFTVVSRHSCRGHRTSGVWVVVSLFVPRVQLPLTPLVSGPTMRDAAQAPVACLGFWTRGEAFSTVLVSLAFNQPPLNMFNNLLLQVFLRWPSQRSGFAWSPTSSLRLPARPLRSQRSVLYFWIRDIRWVDVFR